MGGAGRVAEGGTEGTIRPQGGEVQAVEELQWAWADLHRRQERWRGRNWKADDMRREGGRRVAPH